MINDRIRFPEVRVIDENKEQLGIMRTRDAVDLARDKGQDLILVAAQAQPPVCRIMDYGKFKYEESKSKKNNKKASTELKMVRLHPRTGPHDRDILIRHADKFLREGHKVRAVCQFKGRENAYPQLGKDQLDYIAQALAEISTVEGQITKQGRDMTMMLTPKPGVKPLPKKGQNAEEDAKQAEEDAKFAAAQEELEETSEDEDVDGEENADDEEGEDFDEAEGDEQDEAADKNNA